MSTLFNRLFGWGAAVLMTLGATGIAGAQTTTPRALVYAAYDTQDGAKQAYDAMKETQKQGSVHIDAFAVVSKDTNGRVHVRSTQERDAVAGAVVGALVGAVGGPAGAAVGAGAGGGIGFLTGDAVGIPREEINAIKSSLKPGSSAVIAVLDQRWVSDVERSLHDAQSIEVLDHRIESGAPQPANQGTNPQSAPQTTPQPSP
jgi:uncharacterized membrane protein